MKIAQLADEAHFEDRRDISLINIKKTNLQSISKIKLKNEEILLENKKKLSLEIMKKANSKAEQSAEHKTIYKTKTKEKSNAILNIDKISNLISGINIKVKSKEKIKIKSENKHDSHLEEKYGLKGEQNGKIIKENKPKLNIKDNKEIEEKPSFETDEKIKLELEKKSSFEIGEKSHSQNIKDLLNLNQKVSSFINNKGSIKNKEAEIITKNSNNNNQKVSIKKGKQSTFSLFFSFILRSYIFHFFHTEEEKSIKLNTLHQIKKGKNLNGFPEDQNLSKKDKNSKEEIVNIKIINKNKRNLFYFGNNIIYFLIIAFFVQIVLPNYNLDIIQLKFSNITLKISGTGNKNILTSDNNFNSSYYPNIVYINGEQQDTIKNNYYFNQTDNIAVLIWNNSINYCKCMFIGCTDITEIDVSNFDSSEVTNMASMFRGCPKLSFINFSNFNTSKVSEMGSMFRESQELSSLDLSSFDTSNVISMGAMFHQCIKLTSLNLSSFNMEKVTNMDSMFSGCTNLKYINFKNFNENINLHANTIFENVPENLLVCLNNNSRIILEKLEEMSCYSLDCSDNWEIEQKKLVNINGLCSDISGNDISFKYEYKGRYYKQCSNGNLINSEIQSCQCDNEKCLTCPNEPLKENLCLECNNNYYPIENDNYTHIEGYVKCYKDPIGYYLDKNESLYKKCYYTCKECDQFGNNIIHNCLICDDNYPYNISKNNYSNCYENSSYYIDENNYNYILNSTVPDNYPQILMTTNEVIIESLTEKEVKLKINDLKNVIESITKNETGEKTKEKENEYYNKILTTLQKTFTSENYDTSDLDNGHDEIIETEKMKITLTTTDNQKNNVNKTLTYIDLGECEELLRDFYNLTNNETLYMTKLEINQEGMKIPIIKYYVYSKLYGTNLIKLNLSECQNSKISLSIPVEIDGNLDKLNSSSGYYNDICYTTTSDNGTDISLKDRKNEYVNNTVCQDGCDFVGYDYTSQNAKCSCEVKESSYSFEDMTIDKDRLLDNIKNIKNFANLSFLVCYKILFSKEGLLKNFGFYVFLAIIIYHTINIILFYIKYFALLKKKINDIIYSLKYLYILENIEKNDEHNEKDNNSMEKQIHLDNNDNNNNENEDKHKDENNESGHKKKKRKKRKRKKKRRKTVGIESKQNEIGLDEIINDESDKNVINNNNIFINIYRNKKHKRNTINILKKHKSISKDKLILDKVEKVMEYKDDEINALPYSLALIHDKRTYWQYYISLLKTRHNFIFSFFQHNNYNSTIIQIDLFVVGFSLYYTVSALFYNDDTMHNIYVSNGAFDIAYQLPKILYSSIISMLLNILLKLLALSNDKVLKFKQNKSEVNINERGENLKKLLSIKFLLYFIISFIFLTFFWYYISMFGAIYRNTQFHLLKDTALSFILSLIYPFGIYLIPGFFRLPALADPNKKKECLYKFSQILQLF